MTLALRVVLIGTSSSGRRGLLNALLGRPYDAQADDEGDYSFDDTFQTTLNCSGTAVDLTIVSPFWPGFNDNTDAMQQGFAGLTYMHADGFVLVYAIDDASRFTFETWIPTHVEYARIAKLRQAKGDVEHRLQIETEPAGEANAQFRQTFPFAVVGTKRDKAASRTITSEEGQALAASMNADYVEFSARDDERRASVRIFESLVNKILRTRNAANSNGGRRRMGSVCVLL